MKVLFIDTVHPVLQERMQLWGWDCIDATKWSRQEVLDQASDADGVVIRSKFTIDAEFIGAASSLKFIARSGSGLENIDLELAKSKGVHVVNSPEGNRDAVAEHWMGMVLSLFNNLTRANQEVKKGVWRREGNRGIELGERTVGIIGYGVMGSALAQRLQGFGCRVIAHDKYKSGFSSELVEEVSLEQLQREADVVSFHLPQSAETIAYFDSAFIEKMSHPFYMVNTSRGKVVDTASLLYGLKSEKILGACLDVFEQESSAFGMQFQDPQFNALCSYKNVLMTPHVAGWTVESYRKLSEYLADKLEVIFRA